MQNKKNDPTKHFTFGVSNHKRISHCHARNYKEVGDAVIKTATFFICCLDNAFHSFDIVYKQSNKLNKPLFYSEDKKAFVISIIKHPM